MACVIFLGLAWHVLAQDLPKSSRQTLSIPAEAYHDPNLKASIKNLKDASPHEKSKMVQVIQDQIKAKRAFLGQPPAANPTNVQSTAQNITRSALYKKAGPKESPNWIYNAFAKIQNLFDQDPQINRPPTVPGLGFLPYLLWGLILLIALGILGIGIYYAANMRFRRKRSGKILDETEDASTFDEWFRAAQKYAAESQFRRAIRCAYISGLLQFDGARIARFDRGQTNWQHLARIEASQLLPIGISYREETQLFDQVWYGSRQATASQFDQLVKSVLKLKTQFSGLAHSGHSPSVGQEPEESGAA